MLTPSPLASSPFNPDSSCLWGGRSWGRWHGMHAVPDTCAHAHAHSWCAISPCAGTQADRVWCAVSPSLRCVCPLYRTPCRSFRTPGAAVPGPQEHQTPVSPSSRGHRPDQGVSGGCRSSPPGPSPASGGPCGSAVVTRPPGPSQTPPPHSHWIETPRTPIQGALMSRSLITSARTVTPKKPAFRGPG